MLVLSRCREESILIGEGDNLVKVKVVDIRGDKVRLGFEAPKSIAIHREEVFNEIQKEKSVTV